jgi:hypothetical protein
LDERELLRVMSEDEDEMDAATSTDGTDQDQHILTSELAKLMAEFKMTAPHLVNEVQKCAGEFIMRCWCSTTQELFIGLHAHVEKSNTVILHRVLVVFLIEI